MKLGIPCHVVRLFCTHNHSRLDLEQIYQLLLQHLAVENNGEKSKISVYNNLVTVGKLMKMHEFFTK